MSEPKRIQRKRTKGWKMPDGAIYVGRPSRWGNPYDTRWLGLDLALRMFSQSAHGVWNAFGLDFLSDDDIETLYEAHDSWNRRLGGHPTDLARSELRGLDLACWCPLDQPCHADVLLDIANGRI